MQRRLGEHQKNAALRSGARGSQARKELISFEKEVEGSRLKYVHRLRIKSKKILIGLFI